MQWNAIQCNAMQCNAVQYNTVQHSTIQYNTVQYNAIQYNTIQRSVAQLQCTTVQCNSMLCNAMQCNAIQYYCDEIASTKLFLKSFLAIPRSTVFFIPCSVNKSYGMAWYGMVWYGMVWYGMVWYGMVWSKLYCIVFICRSIYNYDTNNYGIGIAVLKNKPRGIWIRPIRNGEIK